MRPDALSRDDRSRSRRRTEAVLRGGDRGHYFNNEHRPHCEEIGEIARRYKLWFHVDAAYAGSAALLDEHRHILDGAAQADSLVFNPHKWLFTPVDLSILYTRRPEVMRRMLSLEEAPPYLQAAEQDRAVNLAEYSLALGRRFRSLKLWFVLRYFGREGIARILRGHMRMAQDLAQTIGDDPRFEIAAPVLFSLVCFRYRGSDQENRDLLERINASGRAFLVRNHAAREIRTPAHHRERGHHGRRCSSNLGMDQVVSASNVWISRRRASTSALTAPKSPCAAASPMLRANWRKLADSMCSAAAPMRLASSERV